MCQCDGLPENTGVLRKTLWHRNQETELTVIQQGRKPLRR